MPALGGTISALLRKKPKRKSVMKRGAPDFSQSDGGFVTGGFAVANRILERAARINGLDRRIVIEMDKRAEQAKAVREMSHQSAPYRYSWSGGSIRWIQNCSSQCCRSC